jgi:hypothetical protein
VVLVVDVLDVVVVVVVTLVVVMLVVVILVVVILVVVVLDVLVVVVEQNCGSGRRQRRTTFAGHWIPRRPLRPRQGSVVSITTFSPTGTTTVCGRQGSAQ